MRGASLIVLSLISACAAAPAAPIIAAKPATRTVAVAAPIVQSPPPGALFRSDVNAFIDRGFPDFLQRVDVEARLVDGQFRGWSIVDLSPREFWAGVDLRPGDIVTAINDLPIERETEAFDAFESLKQSDALRVRFERDGRSRLLEYRIVSKSN